MYKVINDLLLYSKSSSDEHNFKEVDLSEVFRTVEFNLYQDIKECGAQLILPELPTVIGVESELIHLFQNLIQNAIRFRSNEPLQIKVVFEDNCTSWHFEVTDNGIGMDNSYQERIFLPFQQLHGKSKGGTGIGLSICKKIVNHHEGKIWYYSKGTNLGTSFYFTLNKKLP